MRRPPINSQRAIVLSERAAGMRQAPTLTEHILFQALRGKRLGVLFRRQVVVGPYIVDLLAPAQKLVVEIDGGYHASPAQHRADARRDRALAQLGYRVLRLPGAMVQHQLADAVALVRAALAAP